MAVLRAAGAEWRTMTTAEREPFKKLELLDRLRDQEEKQACVQDAAEARARLELAQQHGFRT